MLKELNVNEIRVSNNTSRQGRYKADVAELMASIKAQGLINPITVKKNGDGYVVVSGHRRLAAIRKLGYKKIDALVNANIENAVDHAVNNLAENVVRKDPSLQEEGFGYHELREAGLSTQEIANRVGVAKTRVERCLQLWDSIPSELRSRVVPNVGVRGEKRNGNVGYALAHKIAQARVTKDEAGQLFQLAQKGVTEAELDRVIRHMKEGGSIKNALGAVKDYVYVSVRMPFRKGAVKRYEAKVKRKLPAVMRSVLKREFSELL